MIRQLGANENDQSKKEEIQEEGIRKTKKNKVGSLGKEEAALA